MFGSTGQAFRLIKEQKGTEGEETGLFRTAEFKRTSITFVQTAAVRVTTLVSASARVSDVNWPKERVDCTIQTRKSGMSSIGKEVVD